MEKLFKNTCYRCGRERIVARVWREKVENSIIENKESVCPDKDCQAIVEQDIARQRNKRLQIEKKRKEMLKKRRTKVIN